MAKRVKVTFTLDSATVERIDRTAHRLGIPKSGVVREAVQEYAARAGALNSVERARLLAVFDDVIARIPAGNHRRAQREIAEVRRARQRDGRRTQSTNKQ